MSSIKLYYDYVWHRVFDAHGRIYNIKEHNRWLYVDVGKDKFGIKNLERKLLIRDFDDVCVYYRFWLNTSHPCPAVSFYVLKKDNKSLTLSDFKNRNLIKR